MVSWSFPIKVLSYDREAENFREWIEWYLAAYFQQVGLEFKVKFVNATGAIIAITDSSDWERQLQIGSPLMKFPCSVKSTKSEFMDIKEWIRYVSDRFRELGVGVGRVNTVGSAVHLNLTDKLGKTFMVSLT